jgi:hypothetical protein
VREILESSADLKRLLREVDHVRGRDREDILGYMLGVNDPRSFNEKQLLQRLPSLTDSTLESFRKLSEAIQTAIAVNPDDIQKGLTADVS